MSKSWADLVKDAQSRKIFDQRVQIHKQKLQQTVYTALYPSDNASDSKSKQASILGIKL